VTAAAGKSALGEFLRARRQALQPEDLGLYRGPRRRADGLRREEVAELTGLSVDYIGRLERGSGPWPSNGLLLAIARGLHLTRVEIGLRLANEKRLEHPEVGRLDLYCQTLSDTESGQALLVYTATPGSKSHERLALLSVIGSDFPRHQ
jgi:transcriptional regulator with XRE-family HTH domain